MIVEEAAAQERAWLRQDPKLEQEWLRQNNLIYGGLIAIGVYLVQPFLTTASLDLSATICVVAFSVAIPLLAAWSIWVGIAISARASDFRVAQQLSTLASLPTAVLAALVAFDVIHPAVGAAATWAQLQRMRICLRHWSTRPGRPSVVISSARFHRLR